MGKGKKITRGISSDFAKAFKKSALYPLYEQHKDELFIGIRNNYLNLYYNCDSISKIQYSKVSSKKSIKESIDCIIDKYYLDGIHYDSKSKEKRHKTTPDKIVESYNVIKKNSDEKSNCNEIEKTKETKKEIKKKKRKAEEKKAQSKLVLLNNANEKSNWFCIDVEYIKQFKDSAARNAAEWKGRFDIIALSKSKPHKVALIELKYGGGSIGGDSGIFKHVKDFVNFKKRGFFESHLKKEIIEIIKSQIELDIDVPFELPTEYDFMSPEYYFIMLDNNKKGNTTPKQTMAGYLFNDKRWECKRLSSKERVESKFGDITKKENYFNATFLFSKATHDNLHINDIIDGSYDEKIFPE